MVDYFISVHPTSSGTGAFSYNSLANAVFNANTDLGAGVGDTVTCEIQGVWATPDSSSVGLATAAGVDSFVIIADASNFFRGDFDASKYRLVTSSASLIGGQLGLEIIGIQVVASTSSSGYTATTVGPIIIDSCYFEGPVAGLRLSSTGSIHARNCMFANSGIGVQAAGSSTVFIGHNCVSRNSTTGYQRNSGSFTVRNCIAESNTTAFTGTMTRTYCASDDGTATGTGGIINATFTFTSSTSGLIDNTDTSGVIGGGIDLSSDATLPVTHDILDVEYLNPPSMGINEAAAIGIIYQNHLMFGFNF